jgi:bifunctional non-homologous end joining protein LigD
MAKSASTKVSFVEPMYAMGVRSLPEGPDWLYEIKFDGYRCIAGKDFTGVSLWSRRGNPLTSQFPAIANACKQLPANTLVDGEIVALDENGRNSFNLLQHHRSKASGIRYYLFDVLVYRGKSLIDAPLSKRRAVLNSLAIAAGPSPVVFSEPVEAPLPELLRAAKGLSLEGVIAKRRDSLYESGKRSGAWVKYKINKGQEFVIGGYTPGNPFDAVIVGYYDGGTLVFAGKVRAGFVPHVRRELMARMKPLEIEVCPFANLPEKRRTQWALTREEMKNCHWLKPQLVAQIEFTEWTPDGHLRHAKYVGLRDDKQARDVVPE